MPGLESLTNERLLIHVRVWKEGCPKPSFRAFDLTELWVNVLKNCIEVDVLIRIGAMAGIRRERPFPTRPRRLHLQPRGLRGNVARLETVRGWRFLEHLL
jgi:hypothetical protein